jgi:hypothetical protein
MDKSYSPYRNFIHKFGDNLAIATTTDPETIWSRGGPYPWPTWTTDQAFTVVSTDPNDTAAGTGVQKVRVEGVDQNYKPIYAEVELAGATPVAIGNFYRVFRMYGIRAGSTLTNAGVITADSGGATYAEISIGAGQTLMCVYTVPDTGVEVDLLGWYVQISRAASAWAIAHFRIRHAHGNGGMGPWRIRESASISTQSPFERSYTDHPIGLHPGDDIELRIQEVSATVGAHGGFDIG